MASTGTVLAGLALSATLAGCAAQASYTPTASMSHPEAMATITRCLEEQSAGYAAHSIEVSADWVRFEKYRGLLGAGRPVATTFYFDTFGRMDMTPKRKGNVVRVWDTNGVMRLVVVIPDPERAKRFMDAMTSMSRL